MRIDSTRQHHFLRLSRGESCHWRRVAEILFLNRCVCSLMASLNSETKRSTSRLCADARRVDKSRMRSSRRRAGAIKQLALLGKEVNLVAQRRVSHRCKRLVGIDDAALNKKAPSQSPASIRASSENFFDCGYEPVLFTLRYDLLDADPFGLLFDLR